MQYNTYYRKDVWDKFEKEKKKSELVNHLLELHYEGDVVKPGSFKEFKNGDVGYKVNPKGKTWENAAKAIKKMGIELTLDQKAEFLGDAYADGEKAYNVARTEEEGKHIAQKEIQKLKPKLDIPGVTVGVKFCKEGHIADEYGKCNTKGCKYAR